MLPSGGTAAQDWSLWKFSPVQLLHLHLRKRPGEVDVADLGADVRRDLRDGDGDEFVFHAASL
jgi:hypothetical protein